MEQKEINELQEAIDTLITLCSAEIMRYSMESFMEGIPNETRYKIATSIAMKSYATALHEIQKYFNGLL